MKYDLDRFDAVEVSPVREYDGSCEPCGEMEADFWSVYARYNPAHPANKDFGGVICLSDHSTEVEAMREGAVVLALIKKATGNALAVDYVQRITY